jgi:hypothetical protein
MKIRVFPSAVAIYYAPSDLSGTRGMFRERIRAVDSWQRGPARHDCVFVQHDPDKPGFRGLYVVRVRLFFSIHHNKTHFPCALVSWYSTIGNMPCADTGMWKVKPDFDNTGNLALSIIHLDSMVRGAHLMGIAGATQIPHHLTSDRSLDAFQTFYVNKYIDHHAHEYAF